MGRVYRTLATRPPHERRVIELLRRVHADPAAHGEAAASSAWRADDIIVFDRFAQAARVAGLRILPPGARYISDDELRAVGWIAYRQRESGPGLIANAALDIAARDCAETLLERQIRLTYKAALGIILLEAGNGNAAPPIPHVGRPPGARRGSLRARALDMASGRDHVHTSEFRRAGISRQTVSAMCAAGLLVKMGCGFYRAQPDRIIIDG